MRAGRPAPTARNLQLQRPLVLTEPEERTVLQSVTHSKLPFAAGILICYDKTACWKRPMDGKLSGEIDASSVEGQTSPPETRRSTGA